MCRRTDPGRSIWNDKINETSPKNHRWKRNNLKPKMDYSVWVWSLCLCLSLCVDEDGNAWEPPGGRELAAFRPEQFGVFQERLDDEGAFSLLSHSASLLFVVRLANALLWFHYLKKRLKWFFRENEDAETESVMTPLDSKDWLLEFLFKVYLVWIGITIQKILFVSWTVIHETIRRRTALPVVDLGSGARPIPLQIKPLVTGCYQGYYS